MARVWIQQRCHKICRPRSHKQRWRQPSSDTSRWKCLRWRVTQLLHPSLSLFAANLWANWNHNCVSAFRPKITGLFFQYCILRRCLIHTALIRLSTARSRNWPGYWILLFQPARHRFRLRTYAQSSLRLWSWPCALIWPRQQVPDSWRKWLLKQIWVQYRFNNNY